MSSTASISTGKGMRIFLESGELERATSKARNTVPIALLSSVVEQWDRGVGHTLRMYLRSTPPNQTWLSARMPRGHP
jgi:hypothetical protein